MTESFFNTGEVLLNYAEGPDHGPALVFIPAQSATWENYLPILNKLKKNFHVFAVSIRGHGKSQWTPGKYNFNTVGQDLILFLQQVVKKRAVIIGNSSGGLIALWMGVNHPELTRGVVLEDAPLFSADWPRIKNEFVYEVLCKTVEFLGRTPPDYRGLFNSMTRPLPDGKIKTLPGWFGGAMAWLVKSRHKFPAKTIVTLLPRKIKRLITDLPTFDPDFSRAWVSGTMYEGLDHETALKNISVPLLIMQANWYRTDKGLVGAMDDKDAERAQKLARRATFLRIATHHGIHSGRPEEFVAAIQEFAQILR